MSVGRISKKTVSTLILGVRLQSRQFVAGSLHRRDLCNRDVAQLTKRFACRLCAILGVSGPTAVFLDLFRAISFFLTILSLLALFDTAFFIVGTTWKERLLACVTRAALAACISLAIGLLFRHSEHPAISPSKTLPVRTFLWSLFGVTVLFAVTWYLDAYYVPLRSRY
jgi:hypothetical protein